MSEAKADKKPQQQVVVAFFDSEKAAHTAVDALKKWDKATEDIKLGQIGILTKDEKGKIKQEFLGPKLGKEGVGIGVVVGVVAVALGPLGLGAVVATGAVTGLVGHFIPAGVGGKGGPGKEGLKQLSDMLDKGHAVVAIFATPGEAAAVTKKIMELGGTASAHEVSPEELKAAEAVQEAAPAATEPAPEQKA
jgi:hypothetical protein